MITVKCLKIKNLFFKKLKLKTFFSDCPVYCALCSCLLFPYSLCYAQNCPIYLNFELPDSICQEIPGLCHLFLCLYIMAVWPYCLCGLYSVVQNLKLNYSNQQPSLIFGVTFCGKKTKQNKNKSQTSESLQLKDLNHCGSYNT